MSNPQKNKVPSQAELIQAIRIAHKSDRVIPQLLDMLEALADGRLVYKSWRNYGAPVGYSETPYPHVWIKKEDSTKDGE